VGEGPSEAAGVRRLADRGGYSERAPKHSDQGPPRAGMERVSRAGAPPKKYREEESLMHPIPLIFYL